MDLILYWAQQRHSVYAVEAANTHVVSMTRSDKVFGAVMDQFDLIVPDGMPLVWSLNRKLADTEKLTDRVYGPELMLRCMEASRGQEQFQHYLLGGSEELLGALIHSLKAKFPDLNIAGTYSPPFGSWPIEEDLRICQAIRESGANLIWVSLGCPKQEAWIARLKTRGLPPGVYFGIGAAFAFHAGKVPQAPGWMQRRGLEWLYRLVMEPRRLWKRYVIYNTLFVYYSLKDEFTKNPSPAK